MASWRRPVTSASHRHAQVKPCYASLDSASRRWICYPSHLPDGHWAHAGGRRWDRGTLGACRIRASGAASCGTRTRERSSPAALKAIALEIPPQPRDERCFRQLNGAWPTRLICSPPCISLSLASLSPASSKARGITDLSSQSGAQLQEPTVWPSMRCAESAFQSRTFPKIPSEVQKWIGVGCNLASASAP